MLRLARAKLSERGLANTELRQADLYALPLGDGEADAAILHHVLHFAQQPGAAIAEAARVLSDGGRLLIADFAPHDREELRTRDAHTRLGFSDEQIAAWFDAAGLVPARTETLEGGELTVKLWLARKTTQPETDTGTRGEGSMTTQNPQSEARRAQASPLFADLAGDAQVSFEFFPPKTPKMEETLWEAVKTLRAARPALRLGHLWRRRIDPRAHPRDRRAYPAREPRWRRPHLTCVEASKAEIDQVAEEYWAAGIRHIVALRGDPPVARREVRGASGWL